ncbi:MAG: hypothetical protein ACREDR_17660 [Blastocatellia bacterium]
MLDLEEQDSEHPDNGSRVFTRRRLAIIVAGVIIAIIAGLMMSYVYTSLDYGGGKNDVLSGKKPSPASGKTGYDKQTHLFLGIIKSEGYSARKGGEVYYIERPGGQLIEVRKELIDLHDPGK